MDNEVAVMSFEQIGEKLGVSRQAVEKTYKNAIKKLRRNRDVIFLQQMADELSRNRERAEILE